MSNHEVAMQHQWVRGSEFAARCPISFYHCVHRNREALLESGAIKRYGRKWLVHPERFYEILGTLDTKGDAA